MSDIDKEEIRKHLEGTLDELKSMGGDIAEKLGGASKDAKGEAKEAWTKLKPKLDNAEEELKVVTNATAEHLKGVFGELKSSLRSLRDKL